MKAALCPVCNGSGKATPTGNPYGTAADMSVTCHGCGGIGWVQVGDDSYISFVLNKDKKQSKGGI